MIPAALARFDPYLMLVIGGAAFGCALAGWVRRPYSATLRQRARRRIYAPLCLSIAVAAGAISAIILIRSSVDVDRIALVANPLLALLLGVALIRLPIIAVPALLLLVIPFCALIWFGSCAWDSTPPKIATISLSPVESPERLLLRYTVPPSRSRCDDLLSDISVVDARRSRDVRVVTTGFTVTANLFRASPLFWWVTPRERARIESIDSTEFASRWALLVGTDIAAVDGWRARLVILAMRASEAIVGFFTSIDLIDIKLVEETIPGGASFLTPGGYDLRIERRHSTDFSTSDAIRMTLKPISR